MRRSLLETDHQLFHSSHQRLVLANFSAFLTTNFDPSIGIAAKSDPNWAFKTISYQPDRPFDPGYLQSGGIYHLHGGLWDEGMNSVNDPIVFLRSEYDMAYGSPEQPGLTSQFLREVFQNYNVVFIGFGMRDPAFSAVMDGIAQIESISVLAQLRKKPGEPPALNKVPHWFRITALPEKGEFAEEQCSIEH